LTRRLSVAFTPAGIPGDDPLAGTVVVIDVLRATSTVTTALAAGAARVLPVATPEAARERARSLDPAITLLCGERGGRPLAGFDLGNSPAEYTPGAVRGRTLVFTSTNGTRAMLRAASAERVILASFLNAAAVVRDLEAGSGPVHLLASGQDGRVALEDLLAAGLLVARLEATGDFRPDDAARIARTVREAAGADLAAALGRTDHGRELADLGFGADLEACARTDVLDLVPVLRRGEIVAGDQAPQASR